MTQTMPHEGHQGMSKEDDQRWFEDLLAQSASLLVPANVPRLPSQLFGSYDMSDPPPFPLEDLSSVSGQFSGKDLEPSEPPPLVPDLTGPTSFAEVANELINEKLGRVSSGDSVVEPDSVQGESGRLYHGYKEGTYYLPNDAAEQDRLDLQHEVFRRRLNGWLALAPIKAPPSYVWDIGTGTGIWAQEFAEQNPSSYVIGTDLSSIQPIPRVVNCEFVKIDAEDSWIFPKPNFDHSTSAEDGDRYIKFDYVHLRMVVSCFNDTTTVIANAFENMNPGGWMEFQDVAYTGYQANPNFSGDAWMRFCNGCAKGALTVGRNMEKLHKYKGWMEEAGFVDVQEKKFIWPFTPWPEDPNLRAVGLYNLQNSYDGIHGVGWKMLKAGGFTEGEIERLISEVRTELRDPENHLYSILYIVIGRKPLDTELKLENIATI
ncbi:S-adenosyl-L-methionine-dependent methyltransferase [Xylariales sp. PMI_506]|nr:S-adenosyl-L-methionine-dependent methyltransferase [Xylariales sp. PMI_506]